MREIPEITDVESVFGEIGHMPKYAEVPERFKDMNDPHLKLFSKLFYSGGSMAELGEPREGVDGKAAFKAIRAIMVSWEPKHEHKEAAVAMLIHEWFEIPGAAS